jgi:hypothetical protein
MDRHTFGTKPLPFRHTCAHRVGGGGWVGTSLARVYMKRRRRAGLARAGRGWGVADREGPDNAVVRHKLT